MSYAKEELRRIWKTTDGRCHLTGKRVRLSDYGATWEVDHSLARARGGSDHGNNLRPALIEPNRSKQARSSRSVREENGLDRSPMSLAAQNRERSENTGTGLVLGAATGAAIGGPAGAVVGGILGALIGNDADVE